MTINGKPLNSFQANFVKELMGDVYMTDTRAENLLSRVCHKYDVNVDALLETVNKNFAIRNEEFKKLEAEELAEVV